MRDLVVKSAETKTKERFLIFTRNDKTGWNDKTNSKSPAKPLKRLKKDGCTANTVSKVILTSKIVNVYFNDTYAR